MLKKSSAAIALVAISLSAAQALPAPASSYLNGTFIMTVTEGLANGQGFNTLPGITFSGFNTAQATFYYTGALNFNNTAPQNADAAGDLNSTFGFSASNISGYSGWGTVATGSHPTTTVANFSSLAGFLGSSGSASNYQWGSTYQIDLGVLAAGTILDVTHDDGISIYQGRTQVGPTVSGPTTKVTDHVALSQTADTMLYFSRQNGSPSILQVSIPEPMSLALVGAGLIGLRWARRRRR